MESCVCFIVTDYWSGVGFEKNGWIDICFFKKRIKKGLFSYLRLKNVPKVNKENHRF